MTDKRDKIGDNDYLSLAAQLVHMTHSGALIQAACLAAELRIADYLNLGPKTADELADLTHSHAPSLARLMRALVSLGICTEDDGTFGLTRMGQLLRADTPESLRSWMLWYGGYVWPVWSHLRHSIKTGESARGLATGVHGFSSFASNPAAAALFNGAMDELSWLISREVVRVYDFSGSRRVIDVGGGQAATLSVILEANPHLTGMCFDMPHAETVAKTILSDDRLGNRGTFTAGDFFIGVPEGGDTYVLKNVLHDWDDDKCIAILRNCHKVVPRDGKLLVIERVLPARVEVLPRHQDMVYADITMLIGPGGQERTETEFRALLEAAGFELKRVVETSLVFSVVEGVVR